MSTTYSAGKATAYGAAVRGGYTGTYEQWCALMADYAAVGQRAEEAAAAAAQSESAAAASAEAAATSEENASASEDNAAASATAAQTAQTGAETAQTAAAGSATAAAQSATQAASSAATAAEVEQQAEEVRDSIPADYTALSDTVDRLERAAIYEDASGDLVSISDGADGGKVKALTIGIEPVQDGSGDPSPDNVRPITGWTGAGVTRTGVNIFGGTLMRDGIKAALPAATIDEDGKYIQFYSNYNVAQFFTDECGLSGKFRESTQYTIIMTVYKSSGTSTNMRIYYTDGSFSNIPSVSEAGVKETVVLVTTANKTVSDIRKVNSSGATRVFYEESGVFEGVLTVDDYVAYAGTTYLVSWETEAGTVYGGSVTLNPDGSADVSACPYYASYAGEALVGPWVSSMDVYSAGATPTTGAQVVDLGGEKTVTHVPAAYTPPILTLLGVNNVYADCGSVNALTYPADTKLYIDGQNRVTRSLIAGIETSMTASKAYSTGDLLIVGDTLYKVAAPIASGATLTPGTNVNPTTVAEQLMLLANA